MRIITKLVLSILTGIIATSSAIVSADTKPVGSGPNPYVDCGIGAALFPSTGWAAVTSNVIWDLGITAITSATASPETCSSKKVKTAQFIFENYDNLAEETAKGQGEHLNAMLHVLGCQANSHTDIISSVRNEMSSIVSKPGYVDKELIVHASDYYNVLSVSVETSFADSCSV
jgi:hypothetical protein